MCFSMKDSQLCLNISIINSLFHYKLRTELPKSNQCVNKTSCVQNLGTYYSRYFDLEFRISGKAKNIQKLCSAAPI